MLSQSWRTPHSKRETDSLLITTPLMFNSHVMQHAMGRAADSLAGVLRAPSNCTQACLIQCKLPKWMQVAAWRYWQLTMNIASFGIRFGGRIIDAWVLS